ncbi:oligopeptide/dipeptide ABC transporter ATP-binding protein [Sporosarcina koreensis]|uniref:oligopeptide/dipeptide ABC transporter ATP-binding protein n=1 Tax=Sporosarcina koreensis TaxID=334735 RepID=UPI000751ECC7
MYLGRIVELAEKKELFKNPLHPYTQALMSAIPSLDPDVKKERIILAGDVPNPAAPPSGCQFAMDVCKTVVPKEIPDNSLRTVSCHMYDDKYRKNF